jgi:hypothetical protein
LDDGATIDNGEPPTTLAHMKPSHSVSFAPLSMIGLRTAVLLAFMPGALFGQVPKSLLPAFGTAGADFTVKGQNNHVVKGWLPTDWKDNTEWAQVDATYSKLEDSPDKAAGAVRIKVEKVDDGQLQLTSYQGIQKYKKGAKYVVTGWVRSPDRIEMKVGVRQKGDPYEFYHEQNLGPGTEWKKFEFTFTPSMELEAFLMFVVTEVGSVDLAGVSIEEKP